MKSVSISRMRVTAALFQRKEVEAQQQRGEELDAMLTDRDRKLAEKEAYIVHLQTALAGDKPITPAPPQVSNLITVWSECVTLFIRSKGKIQRIIQDLQTSIPLSSHGIVFCLCRKQKPVVQHKTCSCLFIV